MIMKNYKTRIVLDTRKKNKKQKYPIRIEIYFFSSQKRWYITIKDLSMLENDFNRITTGKRLKQNDLEAQEYILSCERRVCTLLEDKTPKSNKELKEFYFRKDQNKEEIDIWELFNQKIIQLTNENRPVKTIGLYKTTKNHLKKMFPNLLLSEIDENQIYKFTQKLKKRNISPATIGVYLRNYRAIYNKGVREGVIMSDVYPFKNINTPTRIKKKKALTREKLHEIFCADAKTEKQQCALDIFTLSFLMNGIDLKDICNLKWANIVDNEIIIERTKSKNNVKIRKDIVIDLTPKTKEIIKRQGVSIRNENSYVFPFWDDNMNEVTKANKVNRLLKEIKKYLNELIEANNISTNFKVTYTIARHTFATLCSQSGFSTQMIAEALGHTDVKTTQNYLHGLSREQHNAINDLKMNIFNSI